MEKQFTQQKDKIIETAFREWAKSFFTKTSLSIVAKKLNLSKAALYRYFTNKDHLLNSMTEKFISNIDQVTTRFISAHKKGPLRTLIHEYYDFLFTYFCQHPYYFAFSHSHLMRIKPKHGQQFVRLRQKIDHIFKAALMKSGHTEDGDRLGISVRFIQLTGFFWLMQLFRTDHESGRSAPFFDFSQKINQKKIRQHVSKIQDYCLNGFTSSPPPANLNMSAIENTNWIKPDEMPEPDRIFSAIEQVISEEGYINASVEKIAARIGIHKSSLYFYFKNRDDMLLKTIKREQEHFIDLTNARLKKLNDFSEQLYSFIITLTSYTVNNPGMIIVLNWARYQNVGITLPKRELHKLFSRCDLINQALEHRSLRGSTQDFHSIFVFIFFLIMHKLSELPVKVENHNHYLPFTRQIFTLFCRGITGEIIRTKESQQQKGKVYVKP
jgi:AcrR family transcriptional regulator